ncbi:TRAP transporter large permease subunit [Lentilitoribacter sp. Alg239-R112]|uniref:TRAP transporter large permease subunit n=1 Tax=Lentilitoribacter sp. Alg239-R112 TaxID=2305987 RepID=UPI0013A6FA80|nr:TRAP transporter large permease subunit [Lentilitoribacter sp. Alg239-R112]
MELFFLFLLVVLMAIALGVGYPVAFALPGSSIITILLAAGAGYLFLGDSDIFFAQGGPAQWLSAGVTNLRGVYWEPERDTLIAIPLFIFMGIMLQRSKIAEDLLITMARLFGPVPGGLGISVVFVGALLAATTGIVGATVVAMGLISLPAMLRNNYSQPLATGTIAASGTLGQIIPPSIVLIILADQLSSAADQAGTARKALFKDATGELSMPSIFDVVSTSAGEMFLGAFIPGIVLVVLYMAYILIYAFFNPKAAPPVASEGKIDGAFLVKVVLTLVPPLLLIFLVLGSIIGGIATVNQAGAIGAGGALIMAGYRLREGHSRAYYPALLAIASLVLITITLSLYNTNVKSINSAEDQFGIALAIIGTTGLITALVWSGIRALKIENTLHGVMIETAKTTSLVFIILLGAAILTAAFRAFGGEHLVKEFLEGLPGGFWTKFLIVMAVIFVLGFFLDFIEIAVVVVPIVAPILLADPEANVTAVWLGVMIGLNIQTSFLTPPFGFALFYLRGVAPAVVKTINMYKGVIPFILLQLSALAIVGAVPQLVNYLPNRVSLLSENSPPPRNPKLGYCVDNYLVKEFATNKAGLLQNISMARNIDLSTLPSGMSKDLAKSFDSAEQSFALLDGAIAAEQVVLDASDAYRPDHHFVREVERDIRRLETHKAELETELSRLPEGSEKRAVAINQKLENIDKDITELTAKIPSDWEGKFETYSKLRKTVTSERGKFYRASQEGYEPVVEMMNVLNSTDAFNELKDELYAASAQIEDNQPVDMVEPLAALAKKFGDVAGADKVKSAISKARRAIKARKPNKEKALKEIAKAVKLYDEQIEWRKAGVTNILPKLGEYEQSIRHNIGIRQQPKLTREQALSVAGCLSDHRDISLNF